MMPFAPTLDAMPDTVPVFPLPSAVVVPQGGLPLNIFEPRYVAMVEDALAERGRLIGMIQPRPNSEALYGIGCAGRISAFRETDDGRYLISLLGVSRFTLGEEVTSMRGYRRFKVDFAAFAADLGTPRLANAKLAADTSPITEALRSYVHDKGIQLDWKSVSSLEAVSLINALAQSLPFEVAEKQALLEASTIDDRAELLLKMLGADPDAGRPPVLH